MNWQRYKLLIIGGVVSLVLLLGAGLFLVRSSASYKTTEGKLKSAVTQLRGLRSNDPFPSSSNVDQLIQNREKTRTAFMALHAQFAEGQIEPIPMAPTGFNRYFGQTRNALIAKAGHQLNTGPARDEEAAESPADTSSGVRIPTGFSMGFKQYAAGLPPRQEHIERLTVQLQTVVRLCEDLFELGITELFEITREEFEKSQGNLQDQYMSGMDAGAGDDPGAFDDTEEGSDLYTGEHFKITLTCREEVAWQVLDRLTHYDLFLLLKAVDISNANTNAKLQPQFGDVRASAGRRPSRPERRTRPSRTMASDGEPEKTAEREVLAGRENVKMVLDLAVYRFNLKDATEAQKEE